MNSTSCVRRSWMAALVLVPSAILAADAAAQLVPVSQSRSISASGSVTSLGVTATDSDGDASMAVGAFLETAGVAVREGSGTADAFADQDSLISPTLLRMRGLADAFATGGADEDFSDASASTRFDLTFDLAATTPYELTASGFAFGGSSGFLTLSQGATTIYEFDASFGSDMVALTLSAGQYMLSANAGASGFAFGFDSGDGRAEISFQMEQVPEPASWLLLTLAGTLIVRSTVWRREGCLSNGYHLGAGGKTYLLVPSP